MQGMYAVYRKELGHYFVSPVAYVVVGIFVFVCALVFNFTTHEVISQSMQMQMEGMSSPVDLPGQVMQGYFMFLATLLLFFTPMLTMGVYAEERKRGTMELLMTSPLTEVQIVLGKFFAAFTLFLGMLLPTVVPVIFLYFCSDPHFPVKIVAASYLGALLIGGCLMALGTFISSLTENQIIAAVLTFAVFLLVWIIDILIPTGTSAGVVTVMTYFSVIRPFQDFVRGVINTSSLVYYVSFIAFFVFLTVRSVDSMRWRRA
ncbi:MAG TPA: ABC transporter permease [Candidatus Aquilonibacter sp.]|nr:ABC transporter permease [Candidatus Aquilonibacter sp.]